MLVGLILPAYANVVGPDGISTCQIMQRALDEGANKWYLASTILDNLDYSQTGEFEIIDSDCIYVITPTTNYDDTWHVMLQIDGSEIKEFDILIKDGKISNDEFGLTGLAYNYDKIVLEFTELDENVCYGYAELIQSFDYSAIIRGDIDCFDDIFGTIESEKNFFSRLGEPTIDTFDGLYDITFVTPLIDGDVEKFVIIGEIKIENGVISSEEIEEKYFTSMPNDYEGTVTGNGTVSLFGPCITSGEGYYAYLEFVDDIATGEVGCDSSIPISAAKVTLIPTGQSFPGFTKMSLLDSEKSKVCDFAYVEENGKCVPDPSHNSKKGGGCLIATATYGSELAPQVQLLRELRDNSLLNTESGTLFMNTFNDVYYSFSPSISNYERENPVFREMVKVTITPMITSLSLLHYVDMDSEVEVLGYGVSLIILNVMMYVWIPLFVIMKIRK